MIFSLVMSGVGLLGGGCSLILIDWAIHTALHDKDFPSAAMLYGLVTLFLIVVALFLFGVGLGSLSEVLF